jgi:hypothetical protein
MPARYHPPGGSLAPGPVSHEDEKQKSRDHFMNGMIAGAAIVLAFAFAAYAVSIFATFGGMP